MTVGINAQAATNLSKIVRKQRIVHCCTCPSCHPHQRRRSNRIARRWLRADLRRQLAGHRRATEQW